MRGTTTNFQCCEGPHNTTHATHSDKCSKALEVWGAQWGTRARPTSEEKGEPSRSKCGPEIFQNALNIRSSSRSRRLCKPYARGLVPPKPRVEPVVCSTSASGDDCCSGCFSGHTQPLRTSVLLPIILRTDSQALVALRSPSSAPMSSHC